MSEDKAKNIKKGRRSKNKGKVGEREFANFLSDRFQLKAKRGVQYHGGNDSPDVNWHPLIHWEVKRVESLNLKCAMKQAIGDAGQDKIPAVAHRKNNEVWNITIRAQDLIEFCKIIADLPTTDKGMAS